MQWKHLAPPTVGWNTERAVNQVTHNVNTLWVFVWTCLERHTGGGWMQQSQWHVVYVCFFFFDRLSDTLNTLDVVSPAHMVHQHRLKQTLRVISKHRLVQIWSITSQPDDVIDRSANELVKTISHQITGKFKGWFLLFPCDRQFLGLRIVYVRLKKSWLNHLQQLFQSEPTYLALEPPVLTNIYWHLVES